jgi:hypothetical protein
MPTEFWLTRGGEVLYVERYDKYRQRLIVVDVDGNESERDVRGRAVAGGQTYDDLTRRVSYTSFPVKERVE